METALLLLCPSPSSRMAPRRGDARPPGWCDAAVCTVVWLRAVDFSRLLYSGGARSVRVEEERHRGYYSGSARSYTGRGVGAASRCYGARTRGVGPVRAGGKKTRTQLLF